MKLLLVGNSYTYYNDMPGLLETLLNENGLDAHVFSVTCGARKLIENVTRDDEYSRRLDGLLQSHTFDAALLQDQSLITILDYDRFEAGVTALANKLAPRVKELILYATWGRKDGSPDLNACGLTRPAMTRRISDAYHRAAARVGARVSPVGAAFAALGDAVELYDPDCSHPSYEGSCLAALTHYTTIVGEPPKKCTSLRLDDGIAARMAEAVALVCRDGHSPN